MECGVRKTTRMLARRFYCAAALVFVWGVFVLPSVSVADVFLVGAQLYRTNAAGEKPADDAYQFSTNSATMHNPLPINASLTGLDIATELTEGANVFNYAPFVGQEADPGEYVGLNLFFGTSGTPLSSAPDTVVPGDLTVHTPTDGGTSFSVTPVGTSVISYGLSGTSVTNAVANGLSEITLDGFPISVTSFSADGDPSGTFVIFLGDQVPEPVPEPGTGLVVMGALAMLVSTRCRRAD